jgi:hypothetical protein
MGRKICSLTAGMLFVLGAGLASSTVHGQTPTKNCYEDVGCPWKEEAKFEALRKQSCENLAHVRNRIYHENGYCFHSKAPKDLYGNAGCKHPVQAIVPLNRYERGNIAKIRRIEREKGCKPSGA